MHESAGKKKEKRKKAREGLLKAPSYRYRVSPISLAFSLRIDSSLTDFAIFEVLFLPLGGNMFALTIPRLLLSFMNSRGRRPGDGRIFREISRIINVNSDINV